jgi:hypothetical protein
MSSVVPSRPSAPPNLSATPRDGALTRSLAWIAGLSVLAALGAPACGGTPDEEDAPDVSAARGPAGGGGTGPIAPESTCDPRARQVLSLDGASRNLSWTSCEADGSNAAGTVWGSNEGQRTLTDAEVDSVGAELDQLKVGGEDGCGADAPYTTLDVRTRANTELYVSCNNSAVIAMTGRKPASGVESVWARLYKLSGQ